MLTRLLCLLLRHDPAVCNISIDQGGWTSLPLLVESIRKHCPPFCTLEESEIRDLVASQSVDRFEIRDGRIRCKYGHSFSGLVTAEPSTPPPLLFHGTAASLYERIRRRGLAPQGRSFVHLTSDWEYALTIRQIRTQRTTPGIILAVDTTLALTLGIPFRPASDEVWLSTSLPPRVLSLVTVNRRTGAPQRYLAFSGNTSPACPIESFLHAD
jgi:putative RNA 2'-phosphotransferase